jgi:hypothetical protein
LWLKLGKKPMNMPDFEVTAATASLTGLAAESAALEKRRRRGSVARIQPDPTKSKLIGGKK